MVTLSLQQLLKKRQERDGDAALLVLAAIFGTGGGRLDRRFVLERIYRAAQGEEPADLLDPVAAFRLEQALLQVVEHPVWWLAASGGYPWWE